MVILRPCLPVRPLGYGHGTGENEEDAPPKGVIPDDPPKGVMEWLLKLIDDPFTTGDWLAWVESDP